MIVLRVLQVSIWLLSVFFLVMGSWYLSAGEKAGGVWLYFSLAGAGAVMSLLMHFMVKTLKKHL